ncbi:MAG: hypothetical protein JW910_18520, partial [Anaerolineae bacterium]|nr:hypothetical protein [Anaerolineae bacterium]
LYVDHVLQAAQQNPPAAKSEPPHVRVGLGSSADTADLIRMVSWLRERGVIVSLQTGAATPDSQAAAHRYSHMLHAEPTGALVVNDLISGTTQRFSREALPTLLAFLEAGR